MAAAASASAAAAAVAPSATAASTSASIPTTSSCAFGDCDATRVTKCGCGRVAYCGTEHQKADCAQHKLICDGLINAPTATKHPQGTTKMLVAVAGHRSYNSGVKVGRTQWEGTKVIAWSMRCDNCTNPACTSAPETETRRFKVCRKCVSKYCSQACLRADPGHAAQCEVYFRDNYTQYADCPTCRKGLHDPFFMLCNKCMFRK